MNQSKTISYSRFFFYIVVIITILKDISDWVYSFIGVVNILISLVAIFLLISGFRVDRINNRIVYLILFLILLNIIFVGSGFGSLLAMMVFCYVYLLTPNIHLRKKDDIVFFIGSLLFLVLYYFIDHGTFNDNAIALTFFMVGSFLTLYLDMKKILHLMLFGVIGLFIFYIIMKYDCRTDLAAFAIYVLLRLTPNNLLKNKKLFIILLICLTVGNLVYVYVYMSMFGGLIDFTSFDQFSRSFSDKTFFSGREQIWGDLLDGLHSNPLLGTGSNIKIDFFNGGMLNVHNSMLTFYALYGFPVGILSTILIIRTVLPLHQYIDIPIVKNSFACYASFLLIGFNETIIQADPFRCMIPIILAYSAINRIIRTKQQAILPDGLSS